jgi:hypothetical protein
MTRSCFLPWMQGSTARRATTGQRSGSRPESLFRVTYAVRWIGVKARYHLSVTRVENQTLAQVLD